MTAINALRQGFKLARRSRSVVWILLLANLAVAALAALPIYQGILRSTGHSLMSETLATGFSTDWFTDFAFNNSGSLARYAQIILFFGVLSLPVNSILAGGVLGRFLAPDQSYAAGDFFRSARRYAWRMLWLMAIGLFCYWAVLRVVHVGLGHRADVWFENSIDDRPVFWAKLGVAALTVLGLGFVNLVLDFARVRLVMDEGTGVLQAFLASLGFSLARFGRAVVVYVLPMLCGIALLGIYRLVVPWSAIYTTGYTGSLQQYREPFVLALLFLGQQLIMFGRYWFRVATWAGEWSLYAGLRLPAAGRPASPSDEPIAES
jgi:hypothetical protein